MLSFIGYGILAIFLLFSKLDGITKIMYLILIIVGLLASSIYFTVANLIDKTNSLEKQISSLRNKNINNKFVNYSEKSNSSFINQNQIAEGLKKCPMCNEEVKANMTYCDSCGYKF